MYLTRKKIKLVIWLVVMACSGGFVLHYVTKVFLAYPISNSDNTATSINLINFVETAKTSLSLKKKPFNCPVVDLAGVSFPICVFPKRRDKYVSAADVSGATYFERDNVVAIVKLMRTLMKATDKHRDVTFVDLGTNIGTYSLPVLHNGLKVVSVEAQWEAIRRFTLSLYLSNLTDTHKITLLHNAVTNETGSLLDLKVHHENAGGSPVVPSGRCETSKEYKCKRGAVRSIQLDDVLPLVASKPYGKRRPLVVIKADIEGSEPLVFTEKSASRFFRYTNVVFVQMEWNPSNMDLKDMRSKKTMLPFFIKRGYSIYTASLNGRRLKPSQCLSVRGDLWFIKKKYEEKLLSSMRGV